MGRLTQSSVLDRMLLDPTAHILDHRVEPCRCQPLRQPVALAAAVKPHEPDVPGDQEKWHRGEVAGGQRAGAGVPTEKRAPTLSPPGLRSPFQVAVPDEDGQVVDPPTVAATVEIEQRWLTVVAEPHVARM